MDGDLSLSQALGGLRIANPDDVLEPSSSGDLQTHQTNDSGPIETFASPSLTASIEGLASSLNQTNSQTSADYNTHASPISIPAASPSISTTIEGVPVVSPASSHQLQMDNRVMYTQNHTPPVYNHAESYGMSSSHHGRIPEYAGASPPSMSHHPSAEEWKDRGAAVHIRREIDANGRTVVRQVKKGVRDFSFGRILGEGSYSTVYFATDRQTLKEYAIKVLEKRHIIKEKKIKYVNIEKNTLNRLTEHPGIVRLYYTFQDEASLYYVLDLCNNGELLGVLKKTGTFDVECARFYGAQILDSIDYMHSRGVIHRDLKPENVLLDDRMHIKITDFGTAKLLDDPRNPNDDKTTAPEAGNGGDDDRAASFVGTAEYVSPELLTHKSASRASDIWAFGCIIYQLIAGRPPFKAGSEYLTFQKIVNLEYEFPVGFPPAARDLVERCLVLDPVRRLTIDHIKHHEFFAGQAINRGLWRMKGPRLRPYVAPPQEPNIIQLNGFPTSNTATATIPQRPSPAPLNGTPRPSRIITELPPPTQLDLEWSPVLTRNNERILKLGDLMVISSPLPNSQGGKGSEDGHKKLSRFFGGNTTKKRQRLVMVTSSGRILLVPSGGDDKRAKQELSLLAPDSTWRSQTDAKGQLTWCVDVGGYHYAFEDVKGVTPESGAASADEWVESLDRAKDIAMSREILLGGSEKDFSDLSSPVPSPSNSMAGRSTGRVNSGDRQPRNHLTKKDGDEGSSRKNIFSKRQSRNGLGSAF